MLRGGRIAAEKKPPPAALHRSASEVARNAAATVAAHPLECAAGVGVLFIVRLFGQLLRVTRELEDIKRAAEELERRALEAESKLQELGVAREAEQRWDAKLPGMFKLF